MDELKPCPFCGGKAFIDTVEHPEESRPNGYRFHGRVMCIICQASCGTTGFDLTKDIADKKAIEAWNRRATNRLIEQMQKLLLEIRDNPKLWKRGGAGGQDQYAGLPPFVRLIDDVLNKKEAVTC